MLIYKITLTFVQVVEERTKTKRPVVLSQVKFIPKLKWKRIDRYNTKFSHFIWLLLLIMIITKKYQKKMKSKKLEEVYGDNAGTDDRQYFPF